jgi:predicted unusual protein kinase regulating ubiquinone biosynthesis (AarF/ABC1/UbiB family)
LERTRNCFYKYDSLYLPKTYLTISGKRALVMEFMKGEKIDDIDKLKSLFGEEGPL